MSPPYLPTPADLRRLGFARWHSDGLFRHPGSGAYAVLLPPSRVNLSAAQYERGTTARHETKHAFYAALCALTPGWDYTRNQTKR